MIEQNTKDIRYVDEKVDKLKTDINKAINKQGQQISKLEGELKVFEEQLNHNNDKLESKIDDIQENLTLNFKELTVAITKLAVSEETTSKAVDKMGTTLKEIGEVKHILDEHELRIQSLESYQRSKEQETLDLKKERIKGRFAVISAVVALVASVICALISTLM